MKRDQIIVVGGFILGLIIGLCCFAQTLPATKAATAPASQPSYAATIRVGPRETVKSLEQLKPLIRSNMQILLAAGSVFNFDQGLTLAGTHQRIGAFGTGNPPVLAFSSPKPQGRFPVAISVSGQDVVVEGLEFAPGSWWAVDGVSVSGRNVLVNACTARAGIYEAFKSFGGSDVTFRGCIARGVAYGGFTVSRPGPAGYEHARAITSKRITFERCTFAATLHCIREDATEGLDVLNCYLDGSGARCALTLHELRDTRIIGCKVNNGNIGAGALARGEYLSMPAGPDRDYCLGLTDSNLLIRGNDITLKDAMVITLYPGVRACTIEANSIRTPATCVVNFDGGSNPIYVARRGRAGATIRGNGINGPAGCVLTKGTPATLARNGNTINGKRID